MDTAGVATQDDENLFKFSSMHRRMSAMAWVEKMESAQSERFHWIEMMLVIAFALIVAALSGVLQQPAQGVILGAGLVLTYFSWESTERYFAIRRELREAKALLDAVTATSGMTEPAAREVDGLTRIDHDLSSADQEREERS